MRHISFALTTDQVRAHTKTVTRRVGWKSAKVGEVLMGCVKCQGLKRGEKVERLGPIRVVSVRRERLSDITKADVVREGFPDMSPWKFVIMFCFHNRPDVTPATVITRIEFEYVDTRSEA